MANLSHLGFDQTGEVVNFEKQIERSFARVEEDKQQQQQDAEPQSPQEVENSLPSGPPEVDCGALPALTTLLAALALGCGSARAPEPAGAGAAGPPEEPAAAEPEPYRPDAAPEPPRRWYWAYVADPAVDVVSRVRFGPRGAAYEKGVEVGIMPTEADEPVGAAVDSAGRFWYLVTRRGTPEGRIWKYEVETDRQVGNLKVGLSPSPPALSADGAEAYVLHSGRRGSGDGGVLSVLRTAGDMRESARVPVCDRYRGDGSAVSAPPAVWVLCPADARLVEVSPGEGRTGRSLALDRSVPKGTEEGAEGAASEERPEGAAPDELPGDTLSEDRTCGPSDLTAAPGGARLYVACAARGEVLEVTAGERLEVSRRFPVGPGTRGLAVAPDGRLLLAVNRDGGSVSVVDLAVGREVERLSTSRPRPSDVAVSADGRYAFVTADLEELFRSVVEVIDLRALVSVGEVEVRHPGSSVVFRRSLPVRDGGTPR